MSHTYGEPMSDELSPIITDINTTSPVRVELAEAPHEYPGAPAHWVRVTGTTGMIGYAPHAPDPLAQRIATAADQVHDWILECLPELGFPALWPECPGHPGTHPLTVALNDEVPVWACPRTGIVVAPVGELGSAS